MIKKENLQRHVLTCTEPECYKDETENEASMTHTNTELCNNVDMRAPTDPPRRTGRAKHPPPWHADYKMNWMH
jgi:hypothetical protein